MTDDTKGRKDWKLARVEDVLAYFNKVATVEDKADAVEWLARVLRSLVEEVRKPDRLSSLLSELRSVLEPHTRTDLYGPDAVQVKTGCGEMFWNIIKELAAMPEEIESQNPCSAPGYTGTAGGTDAGQRPSKQSTLSAFVHSPPEERERMAEGLADAACERQEGEAPTRLSDVELERLCLALGIQERDGHQFEDCLNEIDALKRSAAPPVVSKAAAEGKAVQPVSPAAGPVDEQLVNRIVLDVARTSPNSWPEAMMVTDAELRRILRAALAGKGAS